MITAQQALELSISLNNKIIGQLICRANMAIQNVAAEGLRQIELTLDNTEAKIADIVIKDLQSRGFHIKHEKGSDCGESWDYILISW